MIDPLRFAHERGQIKNAANVAEMERLRDALYSSESTVEYALFGEIGAQARAILRVEVSGTLVVRCQRCLGPLPFPLRISTKLIVAEKGRQLEDDAALEWIPAEDHIDPRTLVEEEILLALPVSPRHPEGQCETPA